MNGLDDLRQYQDDFIALAFQNWDPAASVASIAAQPGFAVYRNTLLKACVDNLAANFPTIMRLVGAPWFRAAALEYARFEPPTSVSLFDYGDTFPDFLGRFPPAAELPYLPEVARLDKLWIECHTAADAAPLAAAQIASIGHEALGLIRLSPHPATRWLASDQHPAGAIWLTNREAREFVSVTPWHGDSVLLTRIDNAVHWRLIDSGTVAFLDACARGASLQEAAAHALSFQPDLDIAGTLAMLLQTDAFLTLSERT